MAEGRHRIMSNRAGGSVSSAVTKAVIPAAGLGTRFLPASKVVPKMLLPVVDRPAIQYAVEEVVRSGISEVCIVGSPGGEAVAAHFASSPELEAALERSGKQDLLIQMRALAELAEITYLEQEEPLGLGHAVWMAADFVGDETFLVALPDEIYDPEQNLLQRMVAAYENRDMNVIAVVEVHADQISLYGSIDPEDPEADLMKVRSVVEKPDPEKAPSYLAVVGRYVLDPSIFPILDELAPGALGEIQLTDGLNVLASKGELLAMRYEGRRWDVGQKAGYLEAVVALALERDDLGPEFRQILAKYGNA